MVRTRIVTTFAMHCEEFVDVLHILAIKIFILLWQASVKYEFFAYVSNVDNEVLFETFCQVIIGVEADDLIFWLIWRRTCCNMSQRNKSMWVSHF